MVNEEGDGMESAGKQDKSSVVIDLDESQIRKAE